MTGLLERLRPARGSEGFDRRLIAPMILGAILNPINSSMIAVSSLRVSLSDSGSRIPSRIRSASGRPVAFSSTLPRMTKLVCAYDQHVPGSQGIGRLNASPINSSGSQCRNGSA